MQNRLLVEEQEANQTVHNAIIEAVDDYNKDKGYNMIFSHAYGGVLLYAEDYMNELGDDKTVLKYYTELGIDLHHAGKLDQSMQVNHLGVKAALEKGDKKAAAIMLHNIAAFCAPEFDENVTEGLVTMEKVRVIKYRHK